MYNDFIYLNVTGLLKDKTIIIFLNHNTELHINDYESYARFIAESLSKIVIVTFCISQIRAARFMTSPHLRTNMYIAGGAQWKASG